jgi:hypothetical protein
MFHGFTEARQTFSSSVFLFSLKPLLTGVLTARSYLEVRSC